MYASRKIEPLSNRKQRRAQSELVESEQYATERNDSITSRRKQARKTKQYLSNINR